MSNPFYVGKWSGIPHQARTPKGTLIFRQPGIMIPELIGEGGNETGYFPCMDYDDHFLYKNPDQVDGVVVEGVPQITYLCTCGSPATVVWGDELPWEYRGKLACLYEVGVMMSDGRKGKHVTSQVNVKDFEKLFGGRTLTLGEPAKKERTIFLPPTPRKGDNDG
jgi:hypothetical protein